MGPIDQILNRSVEMAVALDDRSSVGGHVAISGDSPTVCGADSVSARCMSRAFGRLRESGGFWLSLRTNPQHGISC